MPNSGKAFSEARSLLKVPEYIQSACFVLDTNWSKQALGTTCGQNAKDLISVS
jgi:hypothetical protein